MKFKVTVVNLTNQQPQSQIIKKRKKKKKQYNDLKIGNIEINRKMHNGIHYCNKRDHLCETLENCEVSIGFFFSSISLPSLCLSALDT